MTTAHTTPTADARHWINGAWATSTRVTPSTSPHDGSVLDHYADGGEAEARAAIAAARAAFDTGDWARDRAWRARALNELADRTAERRDELVTLLARENRKILAEAAFEVDLAIPKLRYYAALALTDSGRSAEVGPGLYSMTLRQPAGVAAVVTPWNSPVVLAVRSFAPALAAGCAAVVKMPGQTGLVNGLLNEVVAATGSLPDGVLNLFTESGSSGARALVAAPDVDVVSFTGSTRVGRAIMAQAAETLTPVSLELGGKTPMIVFDDADLDAAVPVLTKAVTTFAGQFCMTGSRVLVQRGVADELRARLTASLSGVRLGAGDDPESEIGPMIDREAVARVDAEVGAAIADGARPLLRGGPLTGDDPDADRLAGGAYYRPALLEVSDPEAAIVRREVFGPVATFEVFESEERAVALANATEFGLAASVWTRDADRPLRVGRELDAGTVWTNTWAVVHDQFEEGGFKQSGVGRLNGPRGMEEFQETKHLVRTAPRDARR
ncbi:aldehyde dehydrogenase family protein [Nocardiopsis sp. NPDC050513]|uniref:aldehyde dehydrogenase family protein n=1 Tax=Nocardiopsis sp. NPDC050513 TaxID=3364338 RepID=UPI0037B50404